MSGLLITEDTGLENVDVLEIAGGYELVTNCNQLKMKAKDGKRRFTDVANVELPI